MTLVRHIQKVISKPLRIHVHAPLPFHKDFNNASECTHTAPFQHLLHKTDRVFLPFRFADVYVCVCAALNVVSFLSVHRTTFVWEKEAFPKKRKSLPDHYRRRAALARVFANTPPFVFAFTGGWNG